VRITEDLDLWVEERGPADRSPLLLVMGANASGLTWPEPFVDRLAERLRVIRYDHRDTGRSTVAFSTRPYAIRDLAEDAVAVLDGLGVDRAHVVGMSLGGTLVQLLLLDHPDRLRSATVFATASLAAGEDAPGPRPEVLRFWESMGDERSVEAELDWRVAHWRLLNGGVLPFDDAEFRAVEERIIAHSGTSRFPLAHALADQSGLDRGAELAAVTVPTLVVAAPADPVNPPPHPALLAATIGSARLVTVPGLGHALPAAAQRPLADAVLAFTTEVDDR
jgi:pimeloyl-ACP methyl ester carboxylesterase